MDARRLLSARLAGASPHLAPGTKHQDLNLGLPEATAVPSPQQSAASFHRKISVVCCCFLIVMKMFPLKQGT